jgi:hypothetical protein
VRLTEIRSIHADASHLAGLSRRLSIGAYYLPDALPKALVDALGGPIPMLSAAMSQRRAPRALR